MATLELTFDPRPIGADIEWLVIEATAGTSRGRSQPGNTQWRLIGVFTDVDSPLDLTTQYEAIWGAIQPGNRIFARVHKIAFNGLATPKIISSAVPT